MDRAGRTLAIGALVALTLSAVAGHHRFSGPVLVSLGSHGVHLGDLGVLLVALVGAAGVLLLRTR